MPAHIALIIKGNREAALAHAKAHGIALFSTHPCSVDSTKTHALCGEEYHEQVVTWFLEPPAVPESSGHLLSWELRPTVWKD